MIDTVPLPLDGALPEPVEWRRLGPRLWVGRTAGGPTRMVELGFGYVASDGEGTLHGRFRTLEAAQAAPAGPAVPRSTRLALLVTTAVTAGVGAGSLALLGLLLLR